MKKVFSFFAMALLLLGATSCGGDDNNEQVISSSLDMLNKATLLSNPTSNYVSESGAYVTWTTNYDYNRLSLTQEMKIDDNTSAEIILKDITMTYDSSMECYYFSTDNGGNGITNVKGYYQPFNLTLYYEFTYNGTHKVSTIAHLAYPYYSAIINDISLSQSPFSPTKTAMAMMVSPTTMTAQLKFINFQLSDSDSYPETITFTEGLNVTPNANGYIINGTDVKNSGDDYTLNEFNATVTYNGMRIEGTFLVNGKYQATFSGTTFAKVGL